MREGAQTNVPKVVKGLKSVTGCVVILNTEMGEDLHFLEVVLEADCAM